MKFYSHDSMPQVIKLTTRVLFDSGVVGIKCFFVVTFVSVAHKLQHLRQI